jgi:Tfp pilus assembly protein PilN
LFASFVVFSRWNFEIWVEMMYILTRKQIKLSWKTNEITKLQRKKIQDLSGF